MPALEGFDHPLTGRYASPEMQRLFSTGHRYTTWRRMWLALAEAERYLPTLIDLVLSGKINPGKVFDLTLPLDQVGEGYRAMA